MKSQLFAFFRQPDVYAECAAASDWTFLLAELRKHGLLAKAYFKLHQIIAVNNLPVEVQRQLISAEKYAKKQQHSLFFELRQLEPVLQELDCPCLLLKGAAYRALALKVSHGRLFSDLDILVPKSYLTSVQNKLFFKGFYHPEISEYDRRYYLNWSHQLPPLHHFERDSVIDLHHNIFPPSSAKHLNLAPFFEQAVAIPGSGFKVPCLPHLFVHAALHLFWQEETHRSIKDIIDLNDLLSEVDEQAGLLTLQQEARKIGAEQAVNNVIFVLARLFPSKAAEEYLCLPGVTVKKRWLSYCFMMTLSDHGLMPAICKAIWFIRGHSVKMRWRILLYHSVAKPLSMLKR